MSEALAGRSQWAEGLLDLASSDCRELREIFAENSFPGNLLGIQLGSESRVSCMLLQSAKFN